MSTNRSAPPTTRSAAKAAAALKEKYLAKVNKFRTLGSLMNDVASHERRISPKFLPTTPLSLLGHLIAIIDEGNEVHELHEANPYPIKSLIEKMLPMTRRVEMPSIMFEAVCDMVFKSNPEAYATYSEVAIEAWVRLTKDEFGTDKELAMLTYQYIDLIYEEDDVPKMVGRAGD